MNDGLVLLHYDSSCLKMCDCISDGGVVDIYAEKYAADSGNDSYYEEMLEEESIETACLKQKVNDDAQFTPLNIVRPDVVVSGIASEQDEEDDSDYITNDESASEDDEEARKIKEINVEYKKKK